MSSRVANIRATPIAAAVPMLVVAASCTVAPRSAANRPAGPTGEKITISVGPCFGFCPVYEATIAPDGEVTYNGQWHTEVLGARSSMAGADAYRSIASDLAEFRPADGVEARVPCEVAITDTSSITVTWLAADGRKTIARHQLGCPGGPGNKLDTIFETLSKRLGIDGWAKQVTRPGVSRG